MKHLDTETITSVPEARFAFLSDFIGFGQDDIALIQASGPFLGPKVSDMVDRTYTKLLEFDATAIHFVPKNSGFDGSAPDSLQDLSIHHEQIKFRKDHLNRYIVSLFSRSYDKKMVQYLDMVGKIHTTEAGNKSIVVPLYQMNALLGLISDILSSTLMESSMNETQKFSTLRAFQKLLWIQNDFISRHYTNE